MAYDEFTANRIREVLLEKGKDFEEKKMFMGVCFMVQEKMLCCTHIDKVSGENKLLCRVSDVDYLRLVEENHVDPMEMGKRTMKNYLLVAQPGFDTRAGLENWIDRCLAYNPFAKKSARK